MPSESWFRNSRVRAAILIALLICFAAVMGYALYTLYGTSAAMSRSYAHEVAQMDALQVMRRFDELDNVLTSVTVTVENLRLVGASNRMAVVDALKEILSAYPNICGINICYEPGMYDGLDAMYANDELYSAQGVFNPYVYRVGDELFAEPSYTSGVIDAFSEEDHWYPEFMNDPGKRLEGPHTYEIGGVPVRLVSLFMPILDAAGRFIGLTAVDYDIGYLDTLVNSNNALHSSALVFSAKSELVARSHHSDFLYAESITDLNDDMMQAVASAIEGNGNIRTLSLGRKRFYAVTYPIILNDSLCTGWVYMTVVDESMMISAFTNVLRLLMILVGALALLFSVMFIISLMLRRNALDSLTGLYSRAFLFDRLPKEVRRNQRERRSACLVMCDLDDFKQINDQHGHIAGDVVLADFGKRLCAFTRKNSDWGARYGGEEFVLYLKDMDLQIAARVAERICRTVAEAQVDIGEGKILNYTVSLGVAQIHWDKPMPITELLDMADKNLYEAKRQGKNRVVA